VHTALHFNKLEVARELVLELVLELVAVRRRGIVSIR
jgi:hypothetical protein